MKGFHIENGRSWWSTYTPRCDPQFAHVCLECHEKIDAGTPHVQQTVPERWDIWHLHEDCAARRRERNGWKPYTGNHGLVCENGVWMTHEEWREAKTRDAESKTREFTPQVHIFEGKIYQTVPPWSLPLDWVWIDVDLHPEVNSSFAIYVADVVN